MKGLKYIGWTALAVIFFVDAAAQQENVALQRDVLWQYEKALNDKDASMHTAVKPYSFKELKRAVNFNQLDSNAVRAGIQSLGDTSKFNINAYPLIHGYGGVDFADQTDSKLIAGYGGGAGIHLSAGDKFAANANYFYSDKGFADYVDDFVGRRFVVPGEGLATATSLGSRTHQFTGSITYAPDDHFQFQFGQGRHFIGDGYRSMFLSDNNYAYPYLRITSEFWRFKYTNLYVATKEITNGRGNRDFFTTNFTTMHHLSWNATKRLNINVFETVLWQGADAGVERGYDINYLNPVIFYRPVEFAQGSADNVLLGLGFKAKVKKRLQLYGQILLDEFLLDRVREDINQFRNPDEPTRSGWWANKYSVQLGLKAFDLFKVKGLDVQTEWNWARPYTYTHGTLEQTYTHFGQPLAHPLGANFYEWVNFIRYTKKRFTLEEQFLWSLHGSNPTSSENYGGDLFVPYFQRVREFENFTGQGVRSYVVYNNLRASYLLKQRSNLRIEAGIVFSSLTQ